MQEFFKSLNEAIEHGEPFALATVVHVKSSTPRQPGAKMGIHADGTTFGTVGGGLLEKKVIDDALQAIRDGGSLLKDYSLYPQDQGGIGTECGGSTQIFIDVISGADRLLLVGGGHIAQPLAKLGRMLGMSVEVVDDRPEFASPERFPAAVLHRTSIQQTDFSRLVNPRTWVVIISRSHEIDTDALKAVAGLPAAYVGMIGSKRKVRVIMDRLAADGVDKARLEKVFSPIGLDIGAESPEEIAVSIIAEIISIKRKGISECSLCRMNR
ncbi:MAG: XdhC/CoxI family protein [Planctomycetota bacterium]|nr:XdhC/CoxI family protein [Planctomycetota bacterium]